uniref:Uncharacterized protein n=1 Tax=Amphimedon queenslandica TaxID=400682 RepID=A0A1X7V8B3_AMPQE
MASLSDRLHNVYSNISASREEEAQARAQDPEALMPTQVFDDYWIWQEAPEEKGETLGKWLVFKHKSVIDKTWATVRKAVASGELGPGCNGAKVATMLENPTATNPDIKVICVYTTAEDVDPVGLKLIQLVKQKIRYKTDEATMAGVYAINGFTKTTCRTLDWNNGNPKFTE